MQICAIIFIFMAPVLSHGQAISMPMSEIKKGAESSETTPPTEKREVEKIEVTGSHIKRIDSEGASPVTTITRKELERSGYNSVSDVLRDTTMNSFGSGKETTNSSTPGNAEVDLRGLGSSNTLVLLNGQRLPSDAVRGAVDLSLIPMAAVERVEVLKDGASAIYGSDALGGVVNIITRKDFTGSEVSLSQTTPEQAGGQKNDISLVNGLNAGRLNMVNVVQYRDNQAINSRDRSWSNHGISQTSNFPNYSNGGGSSIASPSCPPSQIQHTPDGDFCTFKYSDYSTEIPELKQLSLLSESNYELNSKVKLTARIGGTQKAVRTQLAPAPGTLNIPGSTADHLGSGGGPLPGATPGEDLSVSLRTLQLGNRENRSQTYSYNALLGTTVDLGKNWQLDVSAAQNDVQTKNVGVNGYSLKKDLRSAIIDGKCNPFDPVAPCDLGGARYTPQESMRSQLTSADIRASGELLKYDAGALGLAVGTSYTFQKYQDSFDERSVSGQVFGNAGSSGGGDRNTRSAYAEISIPVFKKLELQLAERYDHYSDFGDASNPKAAFLYHANRSLLFRGSVGTGFKAPLMQDLYAATSNGFPSFVDHVACDKERGAGGSSPECAPQQYQVTSGGNKGLKEEKSLSYNAGAVFEPNRDFNVGTDFFLIKTTNVVGIDYEDLTLAESHGVNPADFGVTVNRDNSGRITSVNAPLQNLSKQELAGFDFSTAYRFAKFKLSTEQSQMFYFKEEGFPGTGYRNKLGEHGRPPWRNATALAYFPAQRHDLSLVALTTAGQQKTVIDQGRLRDYTQLDLQYAYRSKGLGTFTVGIKNLAGTTPPLDDSDPTSLLNASIYDQVGRSYFTGYKATF